jgi:hypothetical protein
MQKFRLAARGFGDVVPPDVHKPRITAFFDPVPMWYAPFEEALTDCDEFPMHAITQRPMAMYHSWGSQNAWLRQITAANRLFIHHTLAAKHEIEDDDWVWLTSHHGKIKAQVRVMDGVNPDTVWTWNAIGKRKGAWNLDADAPEATKGFLLNHLISELLPERKDGYRYANADPVTGQASWYDLRVQIEKCAPEEFGTPAPDFDVMPARPLPDTPKGPLRYGGEFAHGKSGTSGARGGDHLEFIGNRTETAETVPGVAPGYGNKTTPKNGGTK